MKINYEDEIKNISSLLEGKYKERQDILDNFENINNISYFETLDKEIEDMEEELKILKIKNNNNSNNKNEELDIKNGNDENIIRNLEIGEDHNFPEMIINRKIINDKYIKKDKFDEKNKCKDNIKKMVYESEKYINIIKQNLKIKNPVFNNYYIKLITDLNNLLLNIKLFEKNYDEIERCLK